MANGKPPAVVIIARHGPRLDAADQQWHLHTPTPYDPPLTYGGWNQCCSLGLRIGALLDARERAASDADSETGKSDGVRSHDFAHQDGGSQGSNRKRKRKHNVVIHTSPFLRCVQTSVAIAAGIAQYQSNPSSDSRPAISRARTPNSLHSASPRLRGQDGLGSPSLTPIPEPREDLAHAIARRVLNEHKRHRRCKLRVDAFLGEWLNPQYFDQITPPPPSPLMVTSAKGTLMNNDTVDVFTPTVSMKSSLSSLWSGSSVAKRTDSKDSKDSFFSALDDEQDALPAPAARRDRTSSMSSIGSQDSASGRRSPIRRGQYAQDYASTVPKPETTVYVPPTPHYAISGSENIPKGYVAHARQACVNVDFHWDSSRPPQDWGDGGNYGEEWSAMHKRFRKGVNHLITWYSQHNADDRAEDALGFEQAEKLTEHDEDYEDLVVIMVTHGAGCNALIGAFTGQPVLLDVGMASLTMAVRRDDDGVVHPMTIAGVGDHSATIDADLPSLYDMRIVASSEHLRPGADVRPNAPSGLAATSDLRSGSGGLIPRYAMRLGSLGHGSAASIDSSSWRVESARSRSNTSSALGSVRRPAAPNAAPSPSSAEPGNARRSHSSPTLPPGTIVATKSATAAGELPTPPFSPGLWTPPSARSTPGLQAQTAEKRTPPFQPLDKKEYVPERPFPETLDAQKQSEAGSQQAIQPPSEPSSATMPPQAATKNAMKMAFDGTLEGTIELPSRQERTSLSSTSAVPPAPPASLTRGLSQKGLWGSRPAGDNVPRRFGQEPKRRWTVNEDDGQA